MSISDRIVVMKDGALHQIGAPQSVYDDPSDLFVAKFLGTPPINPFNARIANGKLYIGQEAILSVNLPDQDVTCAIRPEGLIPDPNGQLTCRLRQVEVMGRDTSLLCEHDNFTGEHFRAIIDSDALNTQGSTVKFTVKPNKCHLFAPNGQRIREA